MSRWAEMTRFRSTMNLPLRAAVYLQNPTGNYGSGYGSGLLHTLHFRPGAPANVIYQTQGDRIRVASCVAAGLVTLQGAFCARTPPEPSHAERESDQVSDFPTRKSLVVARTSQTPTIAFALEMIRRAVKEDVPLLSKTMSTRSPSLFWCTSRVTPCSMSRALVR